MTMGVLVAKVPATIAVDDDDTYYDDASAPTVASQPFTASLAFGRVSFHCLVFFLISVSRQARSTPSPSTPGWGT
jgi:hypothetical protein